MNQGVNTPLLANCVYHPSRYYLSHSRLTMKPLLGFFLFLLLATLVGCSMGKKPTYANVKGTVTFNDKPIEKDEITFAAGGLPPSTMDIVDGKFSGQALVGSNRISVSAKKKTANAPKLPKNAEIQIKGYQEKFKA